MRNFIGWSKSIAASRRQELRWFVCAALLSTVLVGLGMTGTVFGASWWDVMTSIGTCGAAIGAVYIAHKNQYWQIREVESSALLYIHTEVVFFLDSLEEYLNWGYFTLEESLRRAEQMESKIMQMNDFRFKEIGKVNSDLVVRLLELRSEVKALQDILHLSPTSVTSIHFFLRKTKDKVREAIDQAKAVSL